MEKKKKKFKIKFHMIFLALTIFYLIGYGIYCIFTFPITNIYIKGNDFLSDWDIIKIAKLNNYPNSITNTSMTIKKRLENNEFIGSAKVYKKNFTIVKISVEENYPLFTHNGKTYLLDGKIVQGSYDVPNFTNILQANMIKKFYNKFKLLDRDIIRKISDIKLDADNVDNERILFTMTDGNYIYVSINKIKEINKYNEYIKEFDNKKGILYINEGAYFHILEG